MQVCSSTLFKLRRVLEVFGILAVCVASSGSDAFSDASGPSQSIYRSIPTEGLIGDCGDCLVVGQSNSQFNESDIDTQGLTREGVDESGLTDGGMDEQDMTREGLDQTGLSTEGIDQQDMTAEGIDQSDLTTEGVEDPAFVSRNPRR